MMHFHQNQMLEIQDFVCLVNTDDTFVLFFLIFVYIRFLVAEQFFAFLHL